MHVVVIHRKRFDELICNLWYGIVRWCGLMGGDLRKQTERWLTVRPNKSRVSCIVNTYNISKSIRVNSLSDRSFKRTENNKDELFAKSSWSYVFFVVVLGRGRNEPFNLRYKLYGNVWAVSIDRPVTKVCIYRMIKVGVEESRDWQTLEKVDETFKVLVSDSSELFFRDWQRENLKRLFIVCQLLLVVESWYVMTQNMRVW